MDRISVIIPVYNTAGYLERSIGSVLNQTYENIEVVAVDDGSVDDSLEVLRKISEKDGRVTVIHQSNSGVTSARLNGIRHATGEWIGFCDSDDYIEPQMYERLIYNAEKYCADISHCGYRMVFPDRADYYYNTGRIVLQDNETGVKDLLEGSFVEPGLCNKLFKAALLQNLLRDMDLSVKYTEDLLMNYYIFKNAVKSVYEDFCPYCYEVRPGSATQKKVDMQKITDPYRVLNIIRSDCRYDSCIPALDGRIASRLIDQLNYKEMKSVAREKLKSLLPEIKQNCSRKTFVMSAWAITWPWSFIIIHKIYGIVKGNTDRYTV